MLFFRSEKQIPHPKKQDSSDLLKNVSAAV